MKHFQIIQSPFVSPVDLQTLHTAYNNLENMHQEAIKTSSELKASIASLNLNEAEDEYKAQLQARIENTIDENTRYGNSAAAYDDIIKLTGDLKSDAGLIGRLKAQQEYLNYQTKIDNLDMPDDYKEYFKEINPYHYSDKVDKNGNVIGGTKWEPVKSPTKIINLSDIIDKALKRVSDDSGQSHITRWLDKNGKPTTDPSKAFDGEIYDVTTNTWQRLGPDKIKEAIYAVIEETPGAKESLDQDYDVALWKHKNNKGTSDELTVSDVTDENGNILSRENYLAKRINDAAKTSAYNRNVTKTTYGDGLSTYLKAKHTPATQQTTTVGIGFDKDTYNILGSSFRSDPITFTYNKGEKANELKANTIYQINDTLSRFGITPNSNIIEDLTLAINSIPNEINGKSTYSIKDMLNNQLMLLEEAQFNLEAIKQNMSDSDKEKYEFSLGIIDGGKAIKDRSKYDNRVINTENNLFNNASDLVVEFKSNADLNGFLKLFSDKTDFAELGVEINEKSIKINSDNRNIIPLIAAKVKTFNRNNTGFITKLLGGKPTYDIKLYDENGNDVTEISYGREGVAKNTSKEYFNDLGDYYNKAEKFSEKFDDKYDVTNKDITVSNIDIYGETFTENYTSQMYNLGLMDLQEKKRIDDNALKTIDNSLANFDSTQYDVYTSKGKLTDAKELQQLKHEFRLALEDGRLFKTSGLVPGIIDSHTGLQGGYTITILPPDNKKNMNGSDPKETKQYYIPALGEEPHLQALNQNATFNASNALDILNETYTTKYLTNSRSNPDLGTITLTGIGNRNYLCDFNGYQFTIDKENATILYTTLGDFKAIKDHINTRGIQADEFLNSNERAKISLINIANILSNITGYSNELIANMLYIDLQH